MFNEYNCYDKEHVRVKSMEVGKKYLVSTSMAASVMNENGSAYPWGGKHQHKIPVKCLSETEHFYTCMVLPHYAHASGFGKSKPYIATIEKWEIMRDGFRVWEPAPGCELEDHNYEVRSEAYGVPYGVEE